MPVLPPAAGGRAEEHRSEVPGPAGGARFGGAVARWPEDGWEELVGVAHERGAGGVSHQRHLPCKNTRCIKETHAMLTIYYYTISWGYQRLILFSTHTWIFAASIWMVL
jgi:hypothetical protein